MSRTLLMIHGIGCTGDVWSIMAPLFEERGWSCIAPTLFPDLRTKGPPLAELPRLGLGDYVEAMASEVRRIEADTGAMPAIIGHSLGGIITQKLAEQGLGAAAVLLTPAAPVDCRVPDLRTLFTFGNIVLKGDPSLGYRIWETGFRYGVLNRVPRERHAAIYAGAVYDSGLVYAQMGDPTKDPAKVGEINEQAIRIPVLTIGATQDRATTIASVRKIAQKYARIGGDYAEYHDNAHWILDEPGTDQVAADIADWLDRHIPPAAASIATA